MMRAMSKVVACQATMCSYNRDGQCHALGINIGGSSPQCDTFFSAQMKCASPDVSSGVGACKVQSCRFNDCLMCSAPEIQVHWSKDARCDTFAPRA